MRKKSNIIPVKSVPDSFNNKITFFQATSEYYHLLQEEAKHDHRHDSHFFVLQELGTLYTEIDFKKHIITSPSIYYQSPYQVHKVTKADDIKLHVLIIKQEFLNLDYVNKLRDLTPIKPILLKKPDLEIILDSFSLCAKLYERTTDKLYFSQLREMSNALVTIMLSQFINQEKPTESLTRAELITKSFTELLESNFLFLKRPSDYAEKMHLSVPYLNESVKQVTGYSTSQIIHERIILESKRLLYHTNKSVKEIAIELGYEDYAYFSRLFTKITHMTPLKFRNENPSH